MIPESSPLVAFVSYARDDKDYCGQLLVALRPLENILSIKISSDYSIAPGPGYVNDLISHLRVAKIVILLVTKRFLQSNTTQVDVEYALGKHKAGKLRIVPVILEDCAWHNSPFASLQALPSSVTPLEKSESKTKFWNEVTSGVAQVVEELAKPQRNSDYELFSNHDLIEMIEECKMAITTIQRAYNSIGGPDDRTLLKLAHIERKQNSFEYELAARITIATRTEHTWPHMDASEVPVEQAPESAEKSNLSHYTSVDFSGNKLEELHQALLSAFPYYGSLSQMIRFKLDENPEAFLSSGNQSDVIFQLIRWADQYGRTEELIRKAHQYNSSNPALTKFVEGMDME